MIKVIALNSELEKVLNSLSTKRAKIYYLKSLGFKPMDISRKLNIISQHVYNELSRVCKNPKEKVPSIKKTDKIS